MNTINPGIKVDSNSNKELMFARNKINELMKEIQILQNSLKNVNIFSLIYNYIESFRR